MTVNATPLNLYTLKYNTTGQIMRSNTTELPRVIYKDHIHEYDWRDMILLICFALVLVIGVFGNALVCFCFRSNQSKKLRKMENLIYWLAIVDLCASLVNPSLYIYWQITQNHHWHFGLIGCKVLPTVAKTTVSISIGLILIITIDRWKSICWPFNPEFKQRTLNIAFFVVIILSILSEIPNIVYLAPMEGGTCVVPEATKPEFAYPSITIYILRDMLLLGTFFLTAIMIHLSLYNKESINTLRDQKNLKQAKETSIMIITLAIVFILLVFPRDILHISYLLSWLEPPGIPYTKQIRDVNATLKVLHMCNSVSNVFIYAGLHGRFRVKVMRLFRLIFCGDNVGSRKWTATSQSESDSTGDGDFEAPILIDKYRFDTMTETDII